MSAPTSDVFKYLSQHKSKNTEKNNQSTAYTSTISGTAASSSATSAFTSAPISIPSNRVRSSTAGSKNLQIPSEAEISTISRSYAPRSSFSPTHDSVVTFGSVSPTFSGPSSLPGALTMATMAFPDKSHLSG